MTTFTWTGQDNNGSVNDPDNWVDPSGDTGVPGPDDTADFAITAAVTGTLNVTALSVTGSLAYDGPSFFVSGDALVDTVDGDLQLDDGATGTIGGNLTVGQTPSPAGDTQTYDSEVLISQGSSLTVDGGATLGGAAGSSGQIQVLGTLTVDGDLAVGVDGVGDLLDEGTINVADGSSISIGGTATSVQSTLTLAGPKAVLNTDEPIGIGIGGFGAFVLTDQAQFTTTGAMTVGGTTPTNPPGIGFVQVYSSTLNVSGDLILGGAAGDGGAVLVESDGTDGPGKVNVSGNVYAGGVADANGTVNIEAGGTFSILDGGSLMLGLYVDSTGVLQIEAPSAVLDLTGALIVGEAGDGQIVLADGGTLSVTGDQALATEPTGSATVVVESDGSFTVGGELVVGQYGKATLLVESGGTVQSTGADIGEFLTGIGTVTVEGADASSALSTWTVDGALTVGDGGDGSLTIQDGGVVTSIAANVGTGTGDSGTVVVDGDGSSWSIAGALTVGVAPGGGTGTPSVTVSDGASVTTDTASGNYDQILSGSLTLETGGALTEAALLSYNVATVSLESGAVLTDTGAAGFLNNGDPVGLYTDGTLTLDDATLVSPDAASVIGGSNALGAGVGSVTAQDGATAASLATIIGYGSRDIGRLTVTGAGTMWTDELNANVDSNAAGLIVGWSGLGTLTVENMAVVSNPQAYIKIGLVSGGVGIATVTGAGSMLNAGGLLRIGDSGTGTLTVENNGAVSVGQVQVGDYAGSIGTLNIDSGATLTTTTSTIDTGPQEVAGGTINVTAGEFDIAVQSGATGDVDVNDGTLTVAGELIVGDGGEGRLTVENGGTVSSASGNVGTGTDNYGSVVVDGATTSWSIAGALTIGVEGGTGDPSVTVSDGASVTTSTDPASYDFMPDGSLTLKSGATLTEASLDMHNAATLIVESGAVLTETGNDVYGITAANSGLDLNGLGTIDDASLVSPDAGTEIGVYTTGGGNGTGALSVQDAATVTSFATFIGAYAGDNGSLTLTGAGTTWTDEAGTPVDSNDAGLNVGVYGTGALTVEDGAVLSNPSAYIKIGQYGGSRGTAIVTGASSMLNAGGLLRIGDSGTGALTVENDGAVSVGQVQVGDFGGSVGTLDIDSGATVTTNSASTVDTGSQNVTGGTINVTAGEFDIGVQAGSQGTVDVDAGTLTVEGSLTVGDGGSGALTAQDAATITSQVTFIGGDTGGSGTLTLSGAGTTLTNELNTGVDQSDAGLNVGVSGTGVLTIEDGAVLSNPSAYIKIGQYGGSRGTATVTGAGSMLSAGGLLRIGDSGTGTLTVENNGAVSVGQVQVGDYASSSGTLNIDSGATLTTTTSTIDTGPQEAAGGGTINVTAGEFDIGVQGGATGDVDVNDGTLTVAGALTVGDSGNGRLTIENDGTVSSALGNVGIGTDNNGSVVVDGAKSSWSIAGYLTIGVQGAAGNPSITVANGGSITTSTDPSHYTFMPNGSMTLETGGMLTETGVDMHNAATLTVESGAVLTETGSNDNLGISPANAGLVLNGIGTIDDASLVSPEAATDIGLFTDSGGSGNGVLTVQDGATATSLATIIGGEAGDTGSLTLTGVGTTWTDESNANVDSNAAGLIVGWSGYGTLTVENKAVISNPQAYIKIGLLSGGVGVATVTGAGSMLSAGGLLRIGDSGTGTLTVENDGAVSVGQVQVGDYASAIGTLDIDSGATLTTTTSTIDTGPQEVAGGTINVTAGEFDIGVQAGSQGTVNVDDGTLTVAGTLTVGDSGTGTLTLSDGGTASAATLQVGVGTSGSGTVTLDVGTTLTAGSVEVGAAGNIVMAGGELDPPNISIDQGGSIAGSGSILGDITNAGELQAIGGALATAGVVNNNAITVDGASLTIGGDLTGTGTVDVTDGSLKLDGAVSAGQTFDIDPSTITIEDPGQFAGMLVLSGGDELIVDGATGGSYAAGAFTFELAAGGTATIAAPSYNANDFTFTQNGNALDVLDTQAPCYCRGTRVATPAGERPVEDIAIGDKVTTLSGEAKPIKWIGRRSYAGRFVMGRNDILPVCIKADALADNVPKRDLWISPHHAMYLEGVLIEAKDLVNGASIVQAEHVDQVEYFHIELETHDVIVAEGAWSESLIDDDSRSMFHNAREYRELYPAVVTTAARYCAPRLQDGYEIEAIRQHIARRAGLVSEQTSELAGKLRGFIDRITPQVIEGWAQNVEHPEAPVCLDILVGRRLIGQVLANRYREDLQQAGIGSGSHSFRFVPSTGTKLAPDAIEVRRSLDGASLTRSADAQHKEKLLTAA